MRIGNFERLRIPPVVIEGKRRSVAVVERESWVLKRPRYAEGAKRRPETAKAELRVVPRGSGHDDPGDEHVVVRADKAAGTKIGTTGIRRRIEVVEFDQAITRTTVVAPQNCCVTAGVQREDNGG